MKKVNLVLLLCVASFFVGGAKDIKVKKESGKKNFWTGDVTYNKVESSNTATLVTLDCIGKGHEKCEYYRTGAANNDDVTTIMQIVDLAVNQGTNSGSGTYFNGEYEATYTWSGGSTEGDEGLSYYLEISDNQ